MKKVALLAWLLILLTFGVSVAGGPPHKHNNQTINVQCVPPYPPVVPYYPPVPVGPYNPMPPVFSAYHASYATQPWQPNYPYPLWSALAMNFRGVSFVGQGPFPDIAIMHALAACRQHSWLIGACGVVSVRCGGACR